MEIFILPFQKTDEEDFQVKIISYKIIQNYQYQNKKTNHQTQAMNTNDIKRLQIRNKGGGGQPKRWNCLIKSLGKNIHFGLAPKSILDIFATMSSCLTLSADFNWCCWYVGCLFRKRAFQLVASVLQNALTPWGSPLIFFEIFVQNGWSIFLSWWL